MFLPITYCVLRFYYYYYWEHIIESIFYSTPVDKDFCHWCLFTAFPKYIIDISQRTCSYALQRNLVEKILRSLDITNVPIPIKELSLYVAENIISSRPMGVHSKVGGASFLSF